MHLCKEYQIRHGQFMEWPPEDRAKALAHLVEEGQRCSSCGTAAWEWEENPYAYEPIAQLCKGCYLKDTTQEDSKNLPGTTIVLEPTSAITPQERMRRLEWEKRLADEEIAEMKKRPRE
jgi:hypothetical protein